MNINVLPFSIYKFYLFVNYMSNEELQGKTVTLLETETDKLSFIGEYLK